MVVKKTPKQQNRTRSNGTKARSPAPRRGTGASKERSSYRWRPLLGSYQAKELRVLKFSSDTEIREAVRLCWNDPELIGMPRDYADELTMVVPAEAVA